MNGCPKQILMRGCLRVDRNSRVCPKCNISFRKNTAGVWECEKCKARPGRFAIWVYLKEKGKYACIRYSQDRIPLVNQETAEIIHSQIRAEITAGTFRVERYTSQKRFFNEWIKSFLQTKEIAYKRKELTLKSIREMRRFARILSEHFGSLLIHSLDTAKVHDFYNSLPPSTPIQNRRVTEFLRSAVRWAIERNEISVHIGFPKFKKINPEIKAITYELQCEVLAHVPREHLPILTFLAMQGCRVSEARALRECDLDRDDWHVTYRQTISGTEVVNRLKEGNRQAVQYLRPETIEMLKRQPKKFPKELLFPSRLKRPYGESTLNRIWRRACREAGVPEVTLKQGSRSSVLTQVAQTGASELEIQNFAHHKCRESSRAYINVAALSTKTTVVRLSEQRVKIGFKRNGKDAND